MDEALPRDGGQVIHNITSNPAAVSTPPNMPAAIGSDSLISHREQERRKLLAGERQRNEEWKKNYHKVKEENFKLQNDFVSLQKEIKSILEETKVFKEKKEHEIAKLQRTIEEKDRLLEHQKHIIAEHDPDKLKARFAEELREPLDKLTRENDNLSREKERLLCELKSAQQKAEYLDRQMQDSVEKARLGREAEVNLLKKEKEELKVKYLEANNTPEGKRIIELSQENIHLKSRLKVNQTSIEELGAQYEKIEAKIKCLVEEQSRTELEHEKQIDGLKSLLSSCREENRKMEEILETTRRERDGLEKELRRLEKEVADSEKAFKALERKFETERQTLSANMEEDLKCLRGNKKALIEEIKVYKQQLDEKTQNCQRLQKCLETKDSEHRASLEALREKEAKERAQIDKTRAAAEAKLDDLLEEKSKYREKFDQLQNQLDIVNGTKMSLEKENIVLRAKLESLQSSQEELERIRRQQGGLYDEITKQRTEYAEINAANKELMFQRDRYKEEVGRIQAELELERKSLAEYRLTSEQQYLRLKAMAEEERDDQRKRLLELQEEIHAKGKEREEMKQKCKKFANLVERMQTKMEAMARKIDELEKQDDDKVPLKIYKQLKKQYKELKRNSYQDQRLIATTNSHLLLPSTNHVAK